VVVVTIDPLVLKGPWTEGYVLERRHTISSEFLGDDEYGHARYDTKRSDLGELLYRLKYRSDTSALDPIAQTAAGFIRGRGWDFEAVLAVPPSQRRQVQPVLEVARAIGAALTKPVLASALVKVKDTPQLKNVFELSERQTILEGAFEATAEDVARRRLLMVDDLYRSGATAAVAAGVLAHAGAAAVYFLALTKTRTRS